jgi:general secretion pathway protein K
VKGATLQRQRGVALIIALVLMALATILAVKIGFGGYVERKRTASMLAAEQAYQFAMGAEALAAGVLAEDEPRSDNPAEPWAQAPQPIPLRPPNDPEGEPLGTLEGFLEDQSGRFNINNLLKNGTDQKPDPANMNLFKKILIAAGLEEKWAEMIRDWIDEDSELSFPDGAEDAVYNSQTPPYRTGNYPLLSTSELLNLPGFGAERFQKLAPYITALPVFTQINTCTAPGLILDALTNSREFTVDPQFLPKNRKSGCFPDNNTLANRFVSGSQQQKDLKDLLTEKSDYFRLTTIVTLGSTEFTLYSLLYRNSKRVTPILRSFGTT